jgi:hypothetical protein
MTSQPVFGFAAACTIAAIGVGSVHASAISTPFLETYAGGMFDGPAPVTDGNVSWTLTPAGYVFSSSSQTGVSMYQIPGLDFSPGTFVTMSADFTVETMGDLEDVIRVGFVAAATGPAFVTDSSVDGYVIYAIEPSGVFGDAELVVTEFNAAAAVEFDADSPLTALTAIGTYTFTTVITYNADDSVDFDISIVGPGGYSFATSFTDPDSPMQGEWFGLYARNFGGAQTRFNDFSIGVIPEPASLALLAAGGALLIGRRRR